MNFILSWPCFSFSVQSRKRYQLLWPLSRFHSDHHSLRSKRSRTKRTKFGPAQWRFSHLGRAKNGARAKMWKGGGRGREKKGTPPPLPSCHLFCSRPIFRSAWKRKLLRTTVRLVRDACYEGYDRREYLSHIELHMFTNTCLFFFILVSKADYMQ